MRSLILAALFCLAMCHASGQILGASNISGTCDAAFTANPDPFNPMVFHFQDRSSGQITLWQWNFGDGSTATNRDPVHAYASGGTFYVCLTVSSSDSVNICHDVFCFAVTVHEPGACVADYRYNYDPANRLKVNFADQSGGNITGWHWDFGDGNSSYERNPIHIFPAEGKFRVCLTAYNVDSVSTCNDVKCDTVEINPQEVCHALFTAELDSLNPAPNTFFFRNNSTGDADRFLWTFDDGATYDTRNVVHRFQTDGPHEACLAIKKEVHGEIVCSDT
ncbi:MAG: PKD domain-containing protein, partial [Bacteroidetes bacterium]|nr:PKD domain-containing protein [Bacteroidota bacterium]